MSACLKRDRLAVSIEESGGVSVLYVTSPRSSSHAGEKSVVFVYQTSRVAAHALIYAFRGDWPTLAGNGNVIYPENPADLFKAVTTCLK
jgi:hypothetical protein